MLIEARTSLKLKMPAGERVLLPNQVLEVPEESVRRLLARTPDDVQVVTPNVSAVRPGDIVSWQSPLFGVLHGDVVEIDVDHVTTRNPVTETQTRIPMAWIVRPAPLE